MRAGMRARWLLVALAFVLGIVGEAREARAQDADEVTILTPPPVPPLANATPEIAPGPDLTPFLNQVVVSVDVKMAPEDEAVWPDVELPTVGILKAGDPLTAKAVRDVISEVLSSGNFADARATLDHDPGGVKVTLRVVPRKIIDNVRINLHNAPVDADEMLRDLDIVAGGEVVASDLPKQNARLEAMLHRRGFPAPSVSITTRPMKDLRRVSVDVRVAAGAPRKVERRVIYAIDATQDERLDAEQFYALKTGMRADENQLTVADSALETRIRSRGHHHATVTHDVVLHRGIVVLRVRADFGPKYETRYEGNDHFDQSTIDDVLDLEDETDRSSSHLIQKVVEFYVKHGFLDVEVSLEQRNGVGKQPSYLVFHVREGERVAVAARSYPCLREADIRNLKEGGPQSAHAIGQEIDSYLEEELPGNDVLAPPKPELLDESVSRQLGTAHGARPAPLDLEPHNTYVAETYERAVNHVQELYRAEGFLSAQIGPVQVVRRRCSPKSPAGECTPMAVPSEPLTEGRTSAAADVCTYDAIGLPLSVPPLEQGATCVPDSAHGIECESRVWLRVPVKLGPRSQLWDIGFSGNEALSPKQLATAADVKLGNYVSTLALEDARRRVSDAYHEEGYAFADVKYSLEQSPDHTRTRVRFGIAENDQVIVRDIQLRGNVFTRDSAIRKRIALLVGQPYRASLVRKTEEAVATLGAFSSVTVALENPYVPQAIKTVVITVVERPRQYTEVSPGFSTGEGFRIRTEYGHNNLWGNAVQLKLSVQLAYIPTPFIIDDTARDNYRHLNGLARIGVRTTASLVFPEIGLGPLWRAGVDGLIVHDLQRDFFLTKLALIPNINYRPLSQVQLTFFQSAEFNNSRIFQSGSTQEYLQSLQAQGINITDLIRQLNVPDGETYAFSQRILATWDRRDNAFNASRGTYVVTGVEHVDGYPTEVNLENARARGKTAPPESHFFKLTQTFGGYIPLPKGLRIASLTRVGVNIQIVPDSQTYPDRLFFLGGVDTMRGWTLYSFIPQDNVDRIFATRHLPDTVPNPANPTGPQIANPQKFTATTQPINGGNLMALERIEIRIPIRGPFETVLFSDIGNLWIDPKYPFEKGVFPMRVAVGSGLRVQTPVGPLAVDYGFNVTKQTYEDLGAINFAIGLF